MPRNSTEDRSGSFRLASPPASEAGWASAPAAHTDTSAVIAALIFAKRQPRYAIRASHVRIGIPPGTSLVRNDTCFDLCLRTSRPGHFAVPGERTFGVPNTLPLQDLTGVLSLAASDKFSARLKRRKQNPAQNQLL